MQPDVYYSGALKCNQRKCSVLKMTRLPCWKWQDYQPIRGVRAETVPIEWLRAENVVGRTNQMASCWKMTTVRAESVVKTARAESVVKNSTCWKWEMSFSAHSGILGHDPYSYWRLQALWLWLGTEHGKRPVPDNPAGPLACCCRSVGTAGVVAHDSCWYLQAWGYYSCLQCFHHVNS